MKQDFYFYIIDKQGNEIFTAKRNCKQPSRTKEWSLNQKRKNKFDDIEKIGARTLYEHEVITLANDKLSVKMIDDSIRYDKKLRMAKDSGIVFDFLGNIKKVE
jgi:hypothetical protein